MRCLDGLNGHHGPAAMGLLRLLSMARNSIKQLFPPNHPLEEVRPSDISAFRIDLSWLIIDRESDCYSGIERLFSIHWWPSQLSFHCLNQSWTTLFRSTWLLLYRHPLLMDDWSRSEHSYTIGSIEPLLQHWFLPEKALTLVLSGLFCACAGQGFTSHCSSTSHENWNALTVTVGMPIFIIVHSPDSVGVELSILAHRQTVVITGDCLRPVAAQRLCCHCYWPWKNWLHWLTEVAIAAAIRLRPTIGIAISQLLYKACKDCLLLHYIRTTERKFHWTRRARFAKSPKQARMNKTDCCRIGHCEEAQGHLWLTWRQTWHGRLPSQCAAWHWHFSFDCSRLHYCWKPASWIENCTNILSHIAKRFCKIIAKRTDRFSFLDDGCDCLPVQLLKHCPSWVQQRLSLFVDSDCSCMELFWTWTIDWFSWNFGCNFDHDIDYTYLWLSTKLSQSRDRVRQHGHCQAIVLPSALHHACIGSRLLAQAHWLKTRLFVRAKILSPSDCILELPATVSLIVCTLFIIIFWCTPDWVVNFASLQRLPPPPPLYCCVVCLCSCLFC